MSLYDRQFINSVLSGYSNMLKKAFITNNDSILNENKSRKIIEAYREINGRIIDDNRVEIVPRGLLK